MRLPNLSSSNAITSKIRELDQQRFMMDRQITSGQKLRLPRMTECVWGEFFVWKPKKGN